MNYNELMESILTAQEKMLQYNIEANSVTLNGRKYGKLIENLPPNIKPTVFGMAVKVDYALPDDYDFLVQYEPPQPKTNADRLRAMSDEELAAFLNDIEVKANNYGYEAADGAPDEYPLPEDWLAWLKQEVSE